MPEIEFRALNTSRYILPLSHVPIPFIIFFYFWDTTELIKLPRMALNSFCSPYRSQVCDTLASAFWVVGIKVIFLILFLGIFLFQHIYRGWAADINTCISPYLTLHWQTTNTTDRHYLFLCLFIHLFCMHFFSFF